MLENLLFKYTINDILIDKDYNIYQVVALVNTRKKVSYQCKPYYFYIEEPYYSEDNMLVIDQDEILCKLSTFALNDTYRKILEARFVYKWSDEQIKEKFQSKW